MSWHHNGVELRGDGDRVTIKHQADMHMYCSMVRISNLASDDAGTYEVRARNREGEATNTLVLNVTPRKDRTKEKKEENAAPKVRHCTVQYFVQLWRFDVLLHNYEMTCSVYSIVLE